MKKKKIILTSLIVLVIVLVAIIVFLNLWAKKNLVSKDAILLINPINTSSPVIYVPKPISLELMGASEKQTLRIATSTENKIQVLARDKDGKIIAYKLIKKDADILKAY